jgi:putative membrane protein
MTTTDLLLTTWECEPSILVGCLALAVAYLAASRFKVTRLSFFFLGGVLALFVATASPIDTLGETYLFSAHMLQHFMLTMIVPPLLLLGIPAELAERALAVAWIAGTERVLRKAPAAWGIGIGAIIAWHIPVFFDAGLENEAIHIAQHLCLLVTATIFWWPVLAPLERRRIHPVLAIPYLSTACMACTAIGVIIVFAPAGLYPFYLNPRDEYGALSLIRDGWGMSVATDQVAAGLIMWVPCCIVYIIVMLVGLGRWYAAPEPEPAVGAQRGLHNA